MNALGVDDARSPRSSLPGIHVVECRREARISINIDPVRTRRSVLRVSAPRRLWRDPRFLGGIALIALSVLACAWLVADARAGEAVYRTTRAIAIGERLDETNIEIVDARTESSAYVLEGALPDGALAAHSMGAQELLAESAVTTEADSRTRRLVIAVAEGLPSSASPGDALELWSLPADERHEEGRPGSVRIAASVTLVKILESDSALTRSASRIEVLVGSSDLPNVLDAMSGRGVLAAVPIGPA